LQTVDFRDVNVRNSTLEDIFLEYYQVSPYGNSLNNKGEVA